MEAKCNFCDFFGEKKHCHNCKVLNNTRTYAPKEIDCSLEELVEHINSNEDISERFGIGDYKTIELFTGEKVKIILLDIDKDKLADSEGNAKATFGILGLDGLFRMNATNTNTTSWKDSEMRTVRMERFMRLLPEAIRNNIKPVIKKTSAGNGSSEIITTSDKCFLFSEIELFNNNEYSKPNEGEQYEYFVRAENRIFNNANWLRSPYHGISYCFCCVDSRGGCDYSDADYSLGVALGFCI